MQNSTRNQAHSSFPKLKRVLPTSHSSKTFSSPEYRHPTADTIFIREIEKRIEDQRKELEQRNIAVRTLLSHFENIASMCKEEKDRNVDLRNQNIELVKEIKHLKKMLDEKTQLAEKPYQKNSSTASGVNLEEYEGIWRENDRLKKDIKKVDRDVQDRYKDINSLNEQLISLKQIISGLEKNLSDANQELSANKSVKRKLEEDNYSAAIQIEKLKNTVNSQRQEIENQTEKLAALSASFEEVQRSLEEREKEMQKTEIWSSKLSEENQEGIRIKERERERDKEKIKGVEIGIEKGIEKEIEKEPFESQHEASDENIELMLDKFTHVISVKDEKIIELNIEIERLKDKINQGNIARKELLLSVGEFRHNNQNDLLKYEKLLAQLENTKKLKDSEIKDLQETISRIESQKRGYMEDLQGLEIQLYNERQVISNLQGKKDELESEIKNFQSKLEEKNEEIVECKRKISKLHETKLKYKLSLKENKAVRDENLKLERIAENLNEKYSRERTTWNKEEGNLNKKIQELHEELNNEKVFNSLHLKELSKLKTALSTQETRFNKDAPAEDDRKLKSKIASLEVDLAEQKELTQKIAKNLEHSNNLILEKAKIITEVEEKNGQLMNYIASPDFIQTSEDAKKIKDRERGLETQVKKLSEAVQAFKDGMTCTVCLKALENPLLLVPCGHSVCQKCLDIRSTGCPYCSNLVQGQYRVEWLDQLLPKLETQKQIISSISAFFSKDF